MDNGDNDFTPPEPTGTGHSTREQVLAIARLIYAFIAPLMLLVPSRYKQEIQEALDKMKEVIDGNVDG